LSGHELKTLKNKKKKKTNQFCPRLLQETFDFYALTTAAAKRENQVDFSPKKKKSS
jgi:hypothetical protein